MQMASKNPDVRRSLWATLTSLRNVLQAANKLVPGTIPAILLLTGIVFFVSLILVEIKIGLVALIVLIGSLFVYFNNKNYADAVVSLTVGLLTAFTVEWTNGRLLMFMIFWSVFLCVVLLASSVKLAGRVQDIYIQAAISTGSDNIESMTTLLQHIGQGMDSSKIGPVEKAEIVRLFAFRKLPVDSMDNGLRYAALLAVVTRIAPLRIAGFVADLYRLSQALPNTDYERLLANAQQMIQECPVSPSEVIGAFEASRHIVLSGGMEIALYLDRLREAITQGLPPEEVAHYIAAYPTG